MEKFHLVLLALAFVGCGGGALGADESCTANSQCASGYCRPSSYTAQFCLADEFNCGHGGTCANGSDLGNAPSVDGSTAICNCPDIAADACTQTGPGPCFCPVSVACDGGVVSPPSCAASSSPPEGGFPASGTFEGAELAGSICEGGAWGILEQTPGGISVPSSLILFLDTGNSGSCQIQTPAGATTCTLLTAIAVPAAAAGTYPSTSADACSHVLFDVGVPPSVTSCPATTDGSCAPGCVPEPGPGGKPGGCTPEPGPEVEYDAQAGGTCLDTETYPQLGSWMLTLTSVTPNASVTKGAYYVAHGSLTAQLVSGSTGATTPPTLGATLTVTF